MTERMGANGLPIKKTVTTIDEINKEESKQMIQEILEENPNEVVLEDELDEIFDSEKEDEDEEL